MVLFQLISNKIQNMAKLKNPITFTMQFPAIDQEFKRTGAIDIVLNADTPLFIDPILLSRSKSKIWAVKGQKTYRTFFENAIKLLKAVKARSKEDIIWRTLSKNFLFTEINYTCLGYGGGKGSGWGPDLVNKILNTAKDIVDLGIEDIDFFMALALFEEGIGADRISDMVTNILLEEIIEYSQSICEKLSLPTKKFQIKDKSVELINNPYTNKPIFFIPMDVVRDLPIARDWSEISDVVGKNQNLRNTINQNVGHIWATMTKKDKAELKNAALHDKESFDHVLKLIKNLKSVDSYDFEKDHNGDIFWLNILKTISDKYPLNLEKFKNNIHTKARLLEVVNELIIHFKHLVENNGLWKEFWTEDNKPRKEKACQRLLFAVASSYCKANDLDLSPEVDSGNGPVDFKISQGANFKVIVEIKLSTNSNTIHGYEKQLEIYKNAEQSDEGIFILIDIGSMGDKFKIIQDKKRSFVSAFGKASEIVVIDANPKASASKRK